MGELEKLGGEIQGGLATGKRPRFEEFPATAKCYADDCIEYGRN
jgi:hypothetical protein